MISDRYLRVLVFGVLLLTSTAAPAKSDFEFSDFVITASKFQRILWREFLIAFPNLYTKKNHRIFNTGTVVFYDSEQRPALLFFANQRMNERKEGTIARITRLNMRSPSGTQFIDITVSDVGKDLKATPLRSLLMGRLPLDLEESELQEKNISIFGLAGKDGRMSHLKMKHLLRTTQSGQVDITLNVVSEERNIFRIREIQNGDSREITWFIEPSSRGGRHTLQAKKVKTDWMQFGTEEYHVDGRERTPAYFQRRFSRYRVQNMIIQYQRYLKRIIESAICHSGCGCKEKDTGQGANNG